MLISAVFVHINRTHKDTALKNSIPLIDKELNDHITPPRKFYKTKTFWASVLGVVSAGLLGDYSAVTPIIFEIVNGVING